MKWIKNNGLSLTFIILFMLALTGQFLTGFKEYNKEREEEEQAAADMGQYLRSGHFLQATFENWESEFLQMALFVVLTISLRQKGSSESKKCEGEGENEVDREPSPDRPGAPWPVRQGGWILRIYKHSLTIAVWFESFQNWQSEFLSVFAIVILSVFLRQKGSPQSKPVDAPNEETGE